MTGLLHRGMEALTALTRWDEPPYGILNYGTEALAGSAWPGAQITAPALVTAEVVQQTENVLNP